MTQYEEARTIDPRVDALESLLRREKRVGDALREVALAIGGGLELEPLLELVLRNVVVALDAERADLFLLDEASGELVARVETGGQPRSLRVPKGDSIISLVAQTGESIIVAKAEDQGPINCWFDEEVGCNTYNLLAVAIHNQLGRNLGVLQVVNKRHGAFSASDKENLAALASQAGVSIDNTRLFLSVTQKNMKLIETAKLLEERLRDLRLLFELEHAMGQATSREELAIAVLGETIRACEAKVACIAMTDEESGSTMAYVAGDHISGLRRIPVVLGEGPIGIPMTSGELMCFGEGASDSLSQSECLQLLGDSCESGFVLPFHGKTGEILGALGVFNKRGHRPFRTSDRDIISLIAVNVSTVMQLQKAREVREREERLTAIGRLMSAVIHDLRTPLTIIGGYVQMMVNAQDIGKRKTYAATVGKQFEQIASMQREVLEFARGERTSLVRKVYVAKFFQEVAEQLEHEFGNYGISLHLLLEYKGTARFDEAKIRRVIHNLARNAAEAMGRGGGRFTIRVGRDNETEELLVEFSDTGPGIPKDVREKLFTSFVTSGKKGGTGLGLAIVKKIVDEHGGRISVRSSRSGATFSLRIPMERDGDR